MLLFAPLSSGHRMNWFAVNIPMDLGGGREFTSDIDIIARLRGMPGKPLAGGHFYRTWEVKVSKVYKDGTTKSLKTGKTKKIVAQLKAYRDFGSPEVSLLDIYLCEAGGGLNHLSMINNSLSSKFYELQSHSFGYLVLPFAYGNSEDGEVGPHFRPSPSPFSLHTWMPDLPVIKLLNAPVTPIGPLFSNLLDRIDNFIKEQKEKGAYKGVFQHTVMFCKECRQVQLIRTRHADPLAREVFTIEDTSCPNCDSNLIAQT